MLIQKNILFPVPAESSPTPNNQKINHPTICKDKLFYLLKIGRDRLKTLKNAVKKNQLPVHGLTAKPSNHQSDQDMYISLHLFFEEISLLAAPRATRIVKMETGKMNEIRDNDENLIELPTNWSCRRLFGKWIETRGWKVTSKNQKGDMDFIDLDGWKGEKKKICAFSTFLNFWKKNYPKIILPKPRKDICNECFIFANSFRSLTNNQSNNTNNNTNTNKEQILSKAKDHIERAASQRLYFDSISKEAKNSNNDVLVLDYC